MTNERETIESKRKGYAGWRNQFVRNASLFIAMMFSASVYAENVTIIDSEKQQWPVNESARHYVFIPTAIEPNESSRIQIDKPSLVFLPKNAKLIEIEPQVYGVKPLAKEVERHYTVDFLVYGAWLAAFGAVLVNK